MLYFSTFAKKKKQQKKVERKLKWKFLTRNASSFFCPFFLDSITMVEAGVIPVTPLRPSGSWWIQVILCQINKIFSQLTQTMTTDFYMNYMFSMCYFTSNCSECKKKFKTILCKVVIQFYVIFWVNWRVNKDFWQISRVFLLRHLWNINHYVKSPSIISVMKT